jgi:putative hemolysin
VSSEYVVSLARTAADVREAQRLRHRVFALELGARVEGAAEGLDRDDLDAACDHLVVRERRGGRVVGTYRMLPGVRAERAGGFYADREFDLRRLRGIRRSAVEVGRACVDPAFRDGTTIALLWAGLLRYVTSQDARWVIGCASVGLAAGHATAAAVCGRLQEEHGGGEAWRVFPRRRYPTDGWARDLAVEPPPLVKSYLRLGAVVCGDAAWDDTFGTADLFLLLPLARLDPRWARRLLRLAEAACADVEARVRAA